MTPSTGTEGPIANAVTSLVALGTLAGVVWLWLNVGNDGSLFVKVVIVALLGAGWLVVVMVAVGILVLLLGAVGIVTRPFWRR